METAPATGKYGEDVRRTVVECEISDRKIAKDSGIFCLGSCFSTEMGVRLDEAGYRICNNPFGVLYNPASIAGTLSLLEGNRHFDEGDVILRDTNPVYPDRVRKRKAELSSHRPIAPCTGGYTSFFHHGSFTRATPEEFLASANASLDKAREAYRQARWVILTFGTAWVYRHLERDIIVSNCHKHPAAEFRREFLEIGEIEARFAQTLENGDKEWIFTVSPVRHRKDGLHANRLSKATLLLAVDRLCRRFPHARYFPSYEIVLDELRDYACYAKDLTHPSAETVDYVYRRFASCFL